MKQAERWRFSKMFVSCTNHHQTVTPWPFGPPARQNRIYVFEGANRGQASFWKEGELFIHEAGEDFAV